MWSDPGMTCILCLWRLREGRDVQRREGERERREGGGD